MSNKTDSELLIFIIDQAIDKGFNTESFAFIPPEDNDPVNIAQFIIDMYSDPDMKPENFAMREMVVNAMLTNHDFCKAYWGEQYLSRPIFIDKDQQIDDLGDETWIVMLQEMIIKKDLLKYYRDHLDG